LTTYNTGHSTISTASTDYSYFAELEVSIDGTDITSEILNQLGWTELGDGTGSHQIINGTDNIDLKSIMTTYGLNTTGWHEILVSVPTSTGGCLEVDLIINRG
jgi:hypothetical protein